jgi:hypothetical protein
MPVIIRSSSKPVPPRGRRGQFNAVVRELAPIVVEIRNDGVQDVRGIAKCLNERGIIAPSGRPFAYTSTLRVLKRLEQLRLGPGPRSLSAAATARLSNPSPRKRSPSLKKELVRIAHEHGE